MATNRVGVRPAIEDQIWKGKLRSANVALCQAKYAGLKMLSRNVKDEIFIPIILSPRWPRRKRLQSKNLQIGWGREKRRTILIAQVSINANGNNLKSARGLRTTLAAMRSWGRSSVRLLGHYRAYLLKPRYKCSVEFQMLNGHRHSPNCAWADVMARNLSLPEFRSFKLI